MTIYTLILYTGIAAAIVSGLTSLIRKPASWWVDYLKNYVGCLMIFSGFVKAIDPMGTAFKIEQYLAEFGLLDLFGPLALFGSVFMIILELALGAALILGVFRKLTVWTFVPLMIVFTLMTGYTSVTGNVTDCGCFGDFLKLKPFVSFLKDIGLCIATALLIWKWRDITPLFPSRDYRATADTTLANDNQPIKLFNKWLSPGLLGLVSLGTAWFCFSNFYTGLPSTDFRPFQNGINLLEAKAKEEADKPISTTYYLITNSETKEEKKVTTTEYTKNSEYWKKPTPWSVDKSRTTQVVEHEGSDSKLLEFEYQNSEGLDVMQETMTNPDYSLMIVSYSRKKSNKNGFKKVNNIVNAAEKDGKKAFCVTNFEAKEGEIDQFRHSVQAAYPFYRADDIMLKTIIRSNPGLVLLKNGTIVRKFHHRELSDYAALKSKYMK